MRSTCMEAMETLIGREDQSVGAIWAGSLSGSTLRYMVGSRLRHFYDGVDGLCNRLRSAGAHAWAESLAAATQGGAPSDEILDRTGTVLRSLHSPQMQQPWVSTTRSSGCWSRARLL